ncbi:NUDIX domain-containing protein [Erythrobacteraceae bacterium WH01K]|nr:NUDIX domain-containing protein [Erythrobacteraceae bacterium WH01K]
MSASPEQTPGGSSPDTRGTPNGIPAATVIIFRNGPEGEPPEILMTVRSKTMTFAGGMAVFPGGRVDPADFELGRALSSGIDPEEAAHQIAVVRETLEETGLAVGLAGDIDAQKARGARALLEQTVALAPVLDEFNWSLDLAQLTPFARWFPRNEKIPRVYDTRFYLANLGTGAVDVAVDQSENTRLFWVSAKGALEMADKGDIKLIFPTRRNLERLALFGSFEEARAHAEATPVRTIIPQIDTTGDRPMLRIMEDAGYPVTAELLDSVARG